MSKAHVGNCWVCSLPVYGNDGLLYHLPSRLATVHRDGVSRTPGDCTTRFEEAIEEALSGIKHPDHFPFKWWEQFGVTESRPAYRLETPKKAPIRLPRRKA